MFSNIVNAGQEPLTLPILNVIDGDTIESSLNLPIPLNKVYIRVNGIDTPESTHLAKCHKEQMAGGKAKEYMRRLLKSSVTMVITDYKWDKYGGRIDANVFIDNINVGEAMIKAGLALPYNGRGDKPDWCKLL